MVLVVGLGPLARTGADSATGAEARLATATAGSNR